MQGFSFPIDFQTADIQANGITVHVRHGGSGAPVLLVHGYGETGDMWAPMAADLARDHAVVIPDLRGLGLSAKPAGGFDKKTQAGDLSGVLDALNIEQVDLVTHDIGNMVGFAFAVQYPHRVRRFMPIDAPIPGVGRVGPDRQEPAALAFSVRRPGHGTIGRRTGANLSRSVLERVFGKSRPVHRGSSRTLCKALCTTGCDALRLYAIRRVRPGCHRQQSIFGQG